MSKDVVPHGEDAAGGKRKRKRRTKSRDNPSGKLEDVKHSQYAKNHGGEKVDLETLNRASPDELIERKDRHFPRDSI